MGKILIFYRYADIKDPQQMVDWQRAVCSALGMTGRVLIAKEGINATVGGSEEATELYKKILSAHPYFKKVDIKESTGDAQHFPRLRVVERKEIVTLNLDPEKITAKHGGKHLTPKQTHKLLSKNPEDLIVLDTRNDYETAIGVFKNAIVPPLKNFKDFPAYVDEHADMFKDKQVVMYCTSGVRCERASAYLKSKCQTKEVYQMEGGIQRYIEKYPDGFFRGKNYVFDGRIAIKANNDILGSCALCSKPCDDYNNCLNANCNKHYISCDDCIKQYNYCCSNECLDLVSTHQVPLRPIYRTVGNNVSNELRKEK